MILLPSWTVLKAKKNEEIAFYISPAGDDSQDGTSIDKPFATLNRARDAIRALKLDGGLKSPVTVYLRGGTYEISEPFILTAEDSGTEACPIVRSWRDARIMTIFAGTNEVMKGIAAKFMGL